MKTLLFLILIGFTKFSYGIQTKVNITASQPDAKIYVDDVYKADEHYEFATDLQIFIIRVEKQGYKTEVRRYMCRPLKDQGFIQFDKGATLDVAIIMRKEENSTPLKNELKTTQLTKSAKTPNKEAEKTKLTVADAYKANTITFYGYDFSHMKFVEEKRNEQGERIVQVITKWQQIINEHNTSKYYQKILRVDTVIMKPAYGERQSELADPDGIIGDDRNVLNINDIQGWLSQYQFAETEGIGYIIFMDCFYKPKKNVAMTFVFFDIATKQILIADKFDGNQADGYGLPHYWAQGVTATIGLYHADVFRKNKRKYRD